MMQNGYCQECRHYLGNKKVCDGILVVCGLGAKHMVCMSVVDCSGFSKRKPAGAFKRWLRRRI